VRERQRKGKTATDTKMEEKAGTREREAKRKAEMASELSELACQFQVKLSEKTRELVDRNYWATLTKLLKNNTHTQKNLPLPYELENVNWINTLFDFLAVEPAHTGSGTVFELEFLIPDVSSFSTPATKASVILSFSQLDTLLATCATF